MMTLMISAFRPEYTLSENVERHTFLKGQLTKLGLTHTTALGSYEGQRELSVNASMSPSDLKNVLKLGEFLEQECILIDTGEGAVFLFDCITGAPNEIGTNLIEVTRKEAMTQVAYTKVNNKYFMVA